MNTSRRTLAMAAVAAFSAAVLDATAAPLAYVPNEGSATVSVNPLT